MKFLLLLLPALLLAACEPAEPFVAEDQSVRPAKLFRVVSPDARLRHEFVGRVEAARTVDMSFQVAGMVEAFHVLEGQEVDKGSLLAELDPEDYKLAVREATVQVDIARQDYSRKQSLVKDKGISESAVDDARALFNLREVHLEQAEENLEDTKLFAGFRGYVSRRFVDDQVNVNAGQPVLRLLDLNTLHIVASIPEDLVATVTAERIKSIFASFPFIPGEKFPLVIRENTGEAGNVAQTYDVTFQMQRSGAWNILPGMTATVEVELVPRESERGLVIPQSAVVTAPDNSFYVWRYAPENGELSKVPVVMDGLTSGGITISGPLSPGDLLVSAGAQQLMPGMKIRPLNDLGE